MSKDSLTDPRFDTEPKFDAETVIRRIVQYVVATVEDGWAGYSKYFDMLAELAPHLQELRDNGLAQWPQVYRHELNETVFSELVARQIIADDGEFEGVDR